MKTIGIMTFHWATNYGAVLQAYALQNFLIEKDYDVRIIDYYPNEYKVSIGSVLRQRTVGGVISKLEEYKKEKAITVFRRAHLKVTRHYSSQIELMQDPPLFDVYISGSDQIWNPYFTMKGEGKPTLSYFLNFAAASAGKLSYASSFGATIINDDMGEVIRKPLAEYDSISVREHTGSEILKKIGYESKVVVDPTLLLNAADYSSLFKSNQVDNEKYIFEYILHGQKKENKTIAYLVRAMLQKKIERCDPNAEVEEWLFKIKMADFVLTNSFHCTVFAILFHIPFLAVPVKGMDMGDRLVTLLDCLGLGERYLAMDDTITIQKCVNTSIDWKAVDERLDCYRQESQNYLLQAISDSLCKKSVQGRNNKNCVGCELCAEVCPKGCITYEEDLRGFSVPKVNENLCIQCGKCVKTCIIANPPQKKTEKTELPIVFSAWHKNESIRSSSSSGGVFSALAEYWIETGGVVFGAAYTGSMEVSHIPITSKQDIEKIRGSKYIPSHAGKAYSQVRDLLAQGKKVLFCGTPCQVAAVKAIAKGLEKNLLCIDLACHGLPSMRIMRDECEVKKKKFGKEITAISFRDKRNGWKDFSLTYWSGKEQMVSEVNTHSLFLRGYIDNVFLRPSCEQCVFSKIPRQGDITLGDNWHIVQEDPTKCKEGISAVLINTPKGNKLWMSCQDKVVAQIDEYQKVIKGTPTFSQCTGHNPSSIDFWKQYCSNGWERAISKHYERESSVLKRIKHRFRKLLKK